MADVSPLWLAPSFALSPVQIRLAIASSFCRTSQACAFGAIGRCYLASLLRPVDIDLGRSLGIGGLLTGLCLTVRVCTASLFCSLHAIELFWDSAAFTFLGDTRTTVERLGVQPRALTRLDDGCSAAAYSHGLVSRRSTPSTSNAHHSNCLVFSSLNTHRTALNGLGLQPHTHMLEAWF
jgi:hypothetical protein